jgi:thiopeptide-type bacteriocin biosynthesis protein
MTERASRRPLPLARRRALLAAVEGAFARTEVATGRTPEERALLERARRIFLAAGSAQLSDALADESWFQVVVACESGADAFLGRELARAARRWLAAGIVRDLAYVRKAPGVRLRLLAGVRGGRLRETVLRHLEQARDRGAIRSWELGFYEPETHQFGGRDGLALFHQFSTIDTLSTLDALAIARSGRGKLPPSAVSLLLVNTLLDVVVPGGPWEHWDVWRNMRLTGRDFAPDDPARDLARRTVETNRTVLGALATDREAALASASRAERALLVTHRRALDTWAARLRRAVRRGALEHGIRTILPFYVVFHWNRFGLPMAEQRVLTYCMQTLLDPRA